MRNLSARLFPPGYTPIARIGSDLHGDVWRVRTTEGTAEPTFPLLLKLPSSAEGTERIRREIDAMSRLVGAEPREAQALISMVDGREGTSALGAEGPFVALRDPGLPTLAARVSRHGRMDEASAAALLGDLLGAVAFAHSRGVVHAAITPLSIFVDSGGSAVLADFGFGPLAGNQSPIDVAVAESNQLTARAALAAGGLDTDSLDLREFLAPEAARVGLLHPGTDLYAVGQVVVFALLGSATRNSLERLVDSGRVSWAFRQMLATLTDPDPLGRYPDAEHARRVVDTIFLNRVRYQDFSSGRGIGGALQQNSAESKAHRAGFLRVVSKAGPPAEEQAPDEVTEAGLSFRAWRKALRTAGWILIPVLLLILGHILVSQANVPTGTPLPADPARPTPQGPIEGGTRPSR